MPNNTKKAPSKQGNIRSYFGSPAATQVTGGSSTMRLHDTSQVEKPDQHPLSDLEPRQKRRKSSTDGHVDSEGRSMMMPSNGQPVVEVSDHVFKK